MEFAVTLNKWFMSVKSKEYGKMDSNLSTLRLGHNYISALL